MKKKNPKKIYENMKTKKSLKKKTRKKPEIPFV